MRLSRPADAAAQYREALRVNVKDAAVHNNLGLALESLGRAEEAAREYRTASELNPSLAEARTNLARVAGRR
jgi:Flp pilus assembly protein TadD